MQETQPSNAEDRSSSLTFGLFALTETCLPISFLFSTTPDILVSLQGRGFFSALKEKL